VVEGDGVEGREHKEDDTTAVPVTVASVAVVAVEVEVDVTVELGLADGDDRGSGVVFFGNL
jgi:hypothetical protein